MPPFLSRISKEPRQNLFHREGFLLKWEKTLYLCSVVFVFFPFPVSTSCPSILSPLNCQIVKRFFSYSVVKPW